MDAIPPPSELPLKFRRKSSSASSTGSHMEFRYNYAEYRDSTSPFSPLPPSSPYDTPCSSSSPPFFPMSLTDDENTESAIADDFDSGRDDATPSWRYRRQRGHNPKSLQIQEPTALLNKYGLYLASDDELSTFANFSAGTLSDHPRQSQLFSSDRNSESADEEDYEFETLDTRIRRTYFAISEERGRWQSSPIPVRTHIRETFPSSPVRSNRRHSKYDTMSSEHDIARRERVDCATGESPYQAFLEKADVDDRSMLPFSSPIPSSSPTYASSPDPTRDQQNLQSTVGVSGRTATPTTGGIHNLGIQEFEVASELSAPQDDQDNGSMFRFSSPLPPSSLPASPMSTGPSGADSPRVDPLILNEDDLAGIFETLCPNESRTSTSVDDTRLYVSRDSPFITDQTVEDPLPSVMSCKRQLSLPPIVSLQSKEEVAIIQHSPQPPPSRLSPSLLSRPNQVDIPSGSKLFPQHVFSKAPLANKKNEPHPGQDQEKVDSLAALGLDIGVGVTASVMSVLPSRTDTPTGISLSMQPPLAGNEQMKTENPLLNGSDGHLISSFQLSEQPEITVVHAEPIPQGMDATTHVKKERKKSKMKVKREDHEAGLAGSQEGCARKKRKVEKGEAPDSGSGPVCKSRGSSGSKRSDRTGRKTGTPRSRSRAKPDKVSPDETSSSHTCGDPSSSLSPSREELPSRPLSPSSDPHIISSSPTESNEHTHAELTGMLVECLGTSRASSMAPSAIHTALTRSHPALKTVERTKREWVTLISSVLEEESGRCGMFGRVESSGKDEKDRPLEARWFYVPERDEDQERAAVISSLMPRPAKRSETKKYKQYYYRPLDKISRWDPEDAI